MPRLDEQQLYDELVSLCYECALDGTRWRDLIDRLMWATGRQQGGLLLSLQKAEFVQVSEVNCINPEAIAPYNEHFCHADPGHLFMPQRAVGHWYHDFFDYGLEAIKRNPYYQEFHRAYGLGHISTIKLFEVPSACAYLSLLTNWDAALPTEKAQLLLDRLTPHLVMAGRVTERLHHLELNIAKRDLLLDNNRTPLWLLDGDAHVLYCNQAAAQFVRHKGSPLQERFSRLSSKSQDASLLALVRRAAGKGGRRQAGWLRLGPPQDTELLVTPVPSESRFNQHIQQPLVMLVLLGNQPRMDLLAELFQLSPAEQRLAELLGQQLTPEACAKVLGVSVNTVRTQLRALFRKTGTSRQAELTGLISRLSS